MIDLHEIRIIQKAVYEVYAEFDKICKEHRLKYYCIGGAVLGAIRHKGFIPWDDDIDVVMPIKDYNLLLEILKNKTDFPYVVNHYSAITYTTGSYVIKLCNPNVKYGKSNGDKIYIHDAFLSIFPLNNLPSSKFNRFLFKYEAKFRFLFLRFVRSAHNGVESNSHSKFEKIGIKLNKILGIGKIISIRTAAEKLDGCLQRYRDKETGYVFWDCMGIAPFEWESRIFQIPKFVLFEDREIPVPTEYEYYLIRCYGDYMQLPPHDERIPKHIDYVMTQQKD